MLGVKQFTQQFKARLNKSFVITIAIGFWGFVCEFAFMFWIAIQIRDDFHFHVILHLLGQMNEEFRYSE